MKDKLFCYQQSGFECHWGSAFDATQWVFDLFGWGDREGFLTLYDKIDNLEVSRSLRHDDLMIEISRAR